MSTMTDQSPATHKVTSPDTPVVALKRRTIDSILIAVGAVLTVALVVAGALLMWGSNFSANYVDDELSSQNISFPPAEALEEEGRTDLVKFGGESVNTGEEAEAYASFIDGHLEGIADGLTYAELGGPEREANAAVEAAVEAGEDEATIAELEAEAAGISGQRNTLFKGETLRGLLLTAYAWSTVGTIAGYAAYAAFAAAAVLLVLVLMGLRHHHKVVQQS
ncbi:MAG: hypothetical protein ACSLFP_07570 [Acidimicrobiales bacterium]